MKEGSVRSRSGGFSVEFSRRTYARSGGSLSADFFESFTPEDLAFDRQLAGLVVVQEDALLAEFLFDHLVFRSHTNGVLVHRFLRPVVRDVGPEPFLYAPTLGPSRDRLS